MLCSLPGRSTFLVINLSNNNYNRDEGCLIYLAPHWQMHRLKEAEKTISFSHQCSASAGRQLAASEQYRCVI